MSAWTILGGLLVFGALLLFSTLCLALQVPSRVRLADEFDRRRLTDAFEAFVAIRVQYFLATSVVRSALLLASFLFVLDYANVSESPKPGVVLVAACLMALALVLVLGVAIPHAWARYSGPWLIVRFLPILSITRVLCYPVIVMLGLFDPVVRRLAGAPADDVKSQADQLEQEILNAVSEGERHGAVDEEEKEMIESVIELSDTRVGEIMTPRTDIVALPDKADRDTVLTTIRTKGHSRMPVFDETIDTVLGVLYAKDLLRKEDQEPFELKTLMRQALFIPESKHVRELLREFQERKLHIAIVLDEYGGTAGLVTIEDILEELVGEIADEYEPDSPAELRRLDDNTVEVDARMRIDDLNDELDVSLPEDEGYETVGGFVFSKLGKIPAVGEQCDHENVGIQVIAAEPRRILRLRLRITPADEKESART